MQTNPFPERLDRFRNLMSQQGLDAFLVTVPENRYYLSGFEAEDLLLTESSGCLMVTHTAKYLLTDPRYEEAARVEAPDFELAVYSTGLKQLLPEIFSRIKPERLGLEEHFLTLKRFREVEEALSKVSPSSRIVSSEDLVERLRIVKDAAEIEQIRNSVRLNLYFIRGVQSTLEPLRFLRFLSSKIKSLFFHQGFLCANSRISIGIMAMMCPITYKWLGSPLPREEKKRRKQFYLATVLFLDAFWIKVFHLSCPSIFIPQASAGFCLLRLYVVGCSCGKVGSLSKCVFIFLVLGCFFSISYFSVHSFHLVIVVVASESDVAYVFGSVVL